MNTKTATKVESDQLFNVPPTEAEATAGKPSRAVAKQTRKAPSSEIVTAQPAERIVPVTGLAEVLGVFERLAVNPNVNPDSLGKLLDVQERLLNRNAEIAFNQAFVEMQPELPVVLRDGRIIVRKKNPATQERDGEIIQNTPYARWETIDEELKPILFSHGFALSHRIETNEKGTRRVTAILRHAGGHVDDSCYFDVESDTTGSKNNIQGWGSGVKYAMRYTGCAALNIITKDDPDNDASSFGAPMVIGEPITPEQLETLINAAGAAQCPEARLLRFLNDNRPIKHPEASKLEYLPATRFNEAVEAIRQWEANRPAREAAAAKQRQKSK